ncbi:uncharacterized protein LOC131858403 [Cryptomeria japonica]|uniref:uncharacterized protein LOC131858403 n=1 Tax=Cryptomeria japonica TaxID=3369 RepID=UPI0027DA9C9B|nr:uncharacterized protein LOC131858403 [Cryptomeria japonica]
MLRKEAKIDWTAETLDVFIAIKRAITEESVLISPDFSKPFLIFSFTSCHTVAAVLLQKNKDGYEQPITYFSKSLSPTKIKYEINEKKAYALVKTAKHFRSYLVRAKVIAYVPNAAYKGTLVKANTEGNTKEEKLKILQEEIDQAMKEMTLERGRLLLKDARILIYSGWDMRSALLFDSFLKKQGPDKQIMPDVIYKIFMGSGYDPDQKALMLWALYPKEKMPLLVDIDEAFGYLMVQQVGKTNPRVTAKLNLGVAKPNQDQVEFLVRENWTCKGLYEKASKEVQ